MKGGGKKKSGGVGGGVGGGGGGGGGEEVNNSYNDVSSNDYKEEEKEKEENKEEEEGEEEEEEEENEEEEGEHEEENGEDEEGREGDERAKLDDGYFEIEAIRRKRVRKGQPQYLIKWRGWPETANTWEPLENLQSCSDVIEAFEESLQSVKSSRKRKRKHSGPHTQSKKKQQPSTDAACGVMDVEISIVDKHLLPSPLLNNTSLNNHPGPPQLSGTSHEGENNGDVTNDKSSKRAINNGSTNGSKQVEERKDENEYDPKLSELKSTLLTNEVNADNLTVHFHDGKASEGNGPAHGLAKVDCVDPVLSNRRTGAKRRKSGSVKRFKQDVTPCESVLDQSLIPSAAGGCSGTVGQLGIGNPGIIWDDTNHMNKNSNSKNASSISKILKPINFSASVSDDSQEVVVTFMAERFDGKEVIVDNKFLKANNPLLLINFYEQHLKYSTP
ncbi:Chromo domain-containing protein [Cephalotus follicularis]|uniref:Chromo domain-containing protein n=1 Tax=Cephalotus follicularis TaxID=3775 RepID=A0A1Q3DA22_CEPFO|nr:Chromo domain-containing protein [Cephalotus follicularis]